MRCPLKYVSVTQRFGLYHKGIDMGWCCNEGKNQPVYACDDGIIIYNRFQKTGGYVIHIRHDNGMCSEYGHLLRDSQLVHEGDRVVKGQQIASMGNSGSELVNGKWVGLPMHLHFGIYRGSYINYSRKGNFVNPLDYINMYDDQILYGGNVTHTKHVADVNDPPLLVHNAKNYNNSSIVPSFCLKNGDQVETYGSTLFGMNIVDNSRGYYCSKKYVK